MDPNQQRIEDRYRTLLILWFAISMSVVLCLVIIFLTPSEFGGRLSLSLGLECAASIPFALSFWSKQRKLNRAITNQRVDQIQSAYIIAFANCQESALVGVLDHFLTGSSYFYVGFIFCSLGMLLHFPQKKHLLAASGQQF